MLKIISYPCLKGAFTLENGVTLFLKYRSAKGEGNLKAMQRKITMTLVVPSTVLTRVLSRTKFLRHVFHNISIQCFSPIGLNILEGDI